MVVQRHAGLLFEPQTKREQGEDGGRVAGQGEERGGHFAEPTMANFMQTKTEGDSSRWLV